MAQLTIANLSRHHLRAVVPKPYQGVGATVVEIVDGQPTNVIINLTTEELFKRRVQEYLNTLAPSTTELNRNIVPQTSFLKALANGALLDRIKLYRPGSFT